jgi:L-asparaginase II
VRFATFRSGQIESTHEVSVIATNEAGQVIGEWGDPEIRFFYRSTIKPFQATVTLEAGAELSDEQLAVACSSHGGLPIHLDLVRAILTTAGLEEDALKCPPAWPRDPAGKELLIAAGHRRPTPLFNNCSGKHSGWLAGATASGFSTADYLDAQHPLQQRVLGMIEKVTGVDSAPLGVDGCGAPTPRGQLAGLARAFGILSCDSRFERAAAAMSRFPALLSSNNLNEGRFAAWWGGPVKGGAQGLMAAGRHGIGVAAKSHEGNVEIAIAAMIEAMRRLGLLSQAATEALTDVAHIPVLGGGRRVGTIEPIAS